MSKGQGIALGDDPLDAREGIGLVIARRCNVTKTYVPLENGKNYEKR